MSVKILAVHRHLDLSLCFQPHLSISLLSCDVNGPKQGSFKVSRQKALGMPHTLAHCGACQGDGRRPFSEEHTGHMRILKCCLEHRRSFMPGYNSSRLL